MIKDVNLGQNHKEGEKETYFDWLQMSIDRSKNKILNLLFNPDWC